MNNHCDLLIYNVQLACMQSHSSDDTGRNYYNNYDIINGGMVAITNGKIDYAGERNNNYQAENTYDGNGNWLIPSLIDCHTHLVYAGNRANEFEQRLQGVSYAQIAKDGGGITSTVKATRAASHQQLLDLALPRAQRLIDEGVSCIEIKSGYGLDMATEIKMLEVAKQLEQHLPVKIITTYLGAHAVPTEYNADEYIDFICNTMIPSIAEKQLADCVDVFCESIGFSLKQCNKVFDAAMENGLNIKAHAEQLSDLKGAKLASRLGALSVDHLEYLADDDVANLKENDTVAVILPGAFYYLNETRKPPIQALRDNQVSMAVATDLNPGSSPIASLLTAMNMACVLFGLTPEEALRGSTVNAAKALNLSNKGSIEAGKDADLCLWEIQHPCELAYGLNMLRPTAKWFGGKRV